jgi:hypothetical protein
MKLELGNEMKLQLGNEMMVSVTPSKYSATFIDGHDNLIRTFPLPDGI